MKFFFDNKINCRMKIMSFVYRSDLLLVFGSVLFFGVLFNVITWIYEQPDGSKIDLSYHRQQKLIDEWKEKYRQEEERKRSRNMNIPVENNKEEIVFKRNQDDIKGEPRNDYLEKTKKINKTEAELRDFNFKIVHDAYGDYEALYVLNGKHRDDGIMNNIDNPETKYNRVKHRINQKENKILFNDDTKISNDSININAPIGGKLVGGPAQCTIYDVTDDINEDYECLSLSIKPSVRVCLYPNEKDIHISQHIRNVGVWEPHIVKEFQNIMFSNPDYGFIDIGANIGQYSLIAAIMGHTVVSIEPYKENLKHLHMGVKIGQFEDRVTVVRNAISDQRLHYASLWVDPHNQGGVRMDRSVKDPCLHANCTKAVKSIYMDDLMEVINFQKAVIKIDIEGHEHRAFIHSKQLFEKVFISHIIMEWMQMRGYYGTDMTQSENKELVYDLVATLHRRGYKAYSLVTGVELKAKFWYAWPDDIIWRHELEEFN